MRQKIDWSSLLEPLDEADLLCLSTQCAATAEACRPAGSPRAENLMVHLSAFFSEMAQLAREET